MELPAEDQITKLMDLLEIPKKKRNFEELQDQIQMLKTFYQSKTANILEKILNNPGLQHLAENIVENLTHKDLKMFGEINQSSKRILDKPRFLLRMFSGLSKENQKDWIKKIESAQNSGKENAIISYIKWMFKRETFFLPCYSRPVIQYCFRQTLQDISKTIGKLSDEDTELVKMMVPLIDNHNAQNVFGIRCTPINNAAKNGHTEIVKILAPLTPDPNSSNNQGETPASITRNAKICKILKSNTSRKLKAGPSTKPPKKQTKKL